MVPRPETVMDALTGWTENRAGRAVARHAQNSSGSGSAPPPPPPPPVTYCFTTTYIASPKLGLYLVKTTEPSVPTILTTIQKRQAVEQINRTRYFFTIPVTLLSCWGIYYIIQVLNDYPAGKKRPEPKYAVFRRRRREMPERRRRYWRGGGKIVQELIK